MDITKSLNLIKNIDSYKDQEDYFYDLIPEAFDTLLLHLHSLLNQGNKEQAKELYGLLTTQLEAMQTFTQEYDPDWDMYSDFINLLNALKPVYKALLK